MSDNIDIPSPHLRLRISSSGLQRDFDFPSGDEKVVTIGGGTSSNFRLAAPIPNAVVCFVERLGEDLTLQPAQELPLRLNGIPLSNVTRLRPDSELQIGAIRVRLEVTQEQEPTRGFNRDNSDDATTSVEPALSGSALDAATAYIPALSDEAPQAISPRSMPHEPQGSLLSDNAESDFAKTEVFGSMFFDEEETEQPPAREGPGQFSVLHPTPVRLGAPASIGVLSPHGAKPNSSFQDSSHRDSPTPDAPQAANSRIEGSREIASDPLSAGASSLPNRPASSSGDSAAETEVIAALGPNDFPSDQFRPSSRKRPEQSRLQEPTASTEVLDIKDSFREARVDWHKPNPRRSATARSSETKSSSHEQQATHPARKQVLSRVPPRTLLLGLAATIMLGIAAFAALKPQSGASNPSEEGGNLKASTRSATPSQAPPSQAASAFNNAQNSEGIPNSSAAVPQQPTPGLNNAVPENSTPRTAANALFEGRYAEAQQQYRALAAAQPQEDAYARLTKLLQKRAEQRCASEKTPGCPEIRQ